MENQYLLGNQTYQPVYAQAYNTPSSSRSARIPISAALTIGAAAGGLTGYFAGRHPAGKDGMVSDKFAKEVFDGHIKKNLSTEGKKSFDHIRNIIKKIDKVKDAESLKNLLKENPLALKLEEFGMSLESYISTINADNFKTVRQNLKQDLEKSTQGYYQKFKTIAQACWDKNSKKFVKPDGMEDNIFNVIKDANKKNMLKKVLKYGGIGAAAAGLAAIACNAITGRYNSK